MYKNKSEIATRNVSRFCWKLKISIFFLKTKFYIYYLAGYPVSGKIIGRISGKFSIQYKLNVEP